MGEREKKRRGKRECWQSNELYLPVRSQQICLARVVKIALYSDRFLAYFKRYFRRFSGVIVPVIDGNESIASTEPHA